MSCDLRVAPLGSAYVMSPQVKSRANFSPLLELAIQHQFQFQSSVSSVKGSICASRARRDSRVDLGHLHHDQVGHGRHLLGLALLVVLDAVQDFVDDDDQFWPDCHILDLVLLTPPDARSLQILTLIL